jgi:hypothetical protein
MLFVDFEKLLARNRKENDVVILPGDTITIPPKPTTVQITGEVVNPGYYQYIPGWDVNDYVRLSGGKTEDGDRTYVYTPAGYTDRVRFFHKPQVQEGATVYISTKKPQEEKEKINWSETIRDTFSLMSSALMIIYLSQQVK